MRFLHTADLHIGASKFLPEFLPRQAAALDSIFEVATAQGVQVVVIAGDIFDNSDTTAEERDLVQNKLLAYDKAGFTILCIPGNHDLVSVDGYTALHFLAMLSSYGKFKHSVITEQTAYHQVEDTIFILVCHRRGHFQEDTYKAIQDLLDASLELTYKHIVVVVHETIKGSKTDIKLKSGDYFTLEHGCDPPDSAAFPQVSYWAYGDIHKCQTIAPNAFYCGSPIQNRFGDDWPKGVLIVDTDAPQDPVFKPVQSIQLVKASAGDAIPEGAYVKLQMPSKQDLKELGTLPANVVKFDYDRSDVELRFDIEHELRDKLIAGVTQQGLTGAELELATKEIDAILIDAGVV